MRQAQAPRALPNYLRLRAYGPCEKLPTSRFWGNLLIEVVFLFCHFKRISIEERYIVYVLCDLLFEDVDTSCRCRAWVPQLWDGGWGLRWQVMSWFSLCESYPTSSSSAMFANTEIWGLACSRRQGIGNLQQKVPPLINQSLRRKPHLQSISNPNTSTVP